ncbi:MAG: Lrp/AsnC family transcriptional regulator [Oscillospiraceae bacterium]|nr:Lrp/AsnC family transcriptional regulator [Oscillospiraceae bacterium]
MTEILKLLEQDSRLTPKQLSAMTGRACEEIEAFIADRETDGTILKYTALVDWGKAEHDPVNALIEVKISPQRGEGYDRIAERIYQYDEVDSLYLMSGAFDLAVMMTAKSMRDVSEFVFARLATIDGVTGTATHFIMKKYKEKNCIFAQPPEQEERGLFV